MVGMGAPVHLPAGDVQGWPRAQPSPQDGSPLSVPQPLPSNCWHPRSPAGACGVRAGVHVLQGMMLTIHVPAWQCHGTFTGNSKNSTLVPTPVPRIQNRGCTPPSWMGW